MADVFISYSRRDTDFVRRLHDFLTANGKDAWVDWEDIPPAAKWEAEIDDSIDDADSFVFVVSRQSLGSDYCAGELRHAGERGKRIVPIACEDLDPGLAPETLRQLNWIWCRDGDDRDVALGKLLPALDTDLDWARAHTRLLVRAVEWDRRRDGSLLLRGNDLENAVVDLAANAGKQPAPTELQSEYVLASRRAARRRQRVILGSVTLALVVSVALGIVALLQRNAANDRARQARSQALAAEAVARLRSNPPAALSSAVEAIETKRTPEARLALRRAILANPVAYAIPAAGKPKAGGVPGRDAIAFSPDGSLLLGWAPYGGVRLWHSGTGRAVEGWPGSSMRVIAASFSPDSRYVLAAELRNARVIDVRRGTTKWGEHLRAGAHVVAAAFSARGPQIVVAASGRTARITNLRTGGVVRFRRRLPVHAALLSGDGMRVLTLAGEDQPAAVWSALDGRLLAMLPGGSARLLAKPSLRNTAAISPDGRFVALNRYEDVRLWAVGDRRPRADLHRPQGVVFSPDSNRVLTVGANGQAGIWNTTDGREVEAFPGFGTLKGAKAGFFYSPFSPGAAFSPDGRLIALAYPDAKVRVFELPTKKQVAAFAAGWANALRFSPRDGLLAAMTWTGAVVLARAPASLPLRTHTHPYQLCAWSFAPVVSPDGSRVLARAASGAVVWTLGGRQVASLRPPARIPGEDRNVLSAAFSGDGRYAAASGAPNQCHGNAALYRAAVWRLTDQRQIRVLPGSGRVLIDTHGRLVAAGPAAWQVATGKRLRRLDGIVALSADGRIALVARGGALAVVDVLSGHSTKLEASAGLGTRALSDSSVSTLLGDDGRRVLMKGNGTIRLWDATTGQPIPLSGRPGSRVDSAAFGSGGRLVLVTFANRATVFDAADGAVVSSDSGTFGRRDITAQYATSAISPDGSVAANAREDGGIDLVDLRTGARVTIQTATALPLDSLSFGPTAGLIVALDRAGDVQVVNCEICKSEDDLTSFARARLAVVSRYNPKSPPVIPGP
jgi:WD40 repeat protein